MTWAPIILSIPMMLMGCVAAVAQAPQPQVQQYPLSQMDFIKIIESYKQQYRQASTEIQRTNLRTKRAEQICRYGTYNAFNWTGNVVEVKSTSDGKAGLFISMENFYLSPSDYISKVEPIYPAILSLNRGDRIAFHGQFHRGSSDCFKQLQLFEGAAMTSPHFTFDITAVTKF